MEILLVEDSPEVSMITVEYLSELGHHSLAVADAERALQELARQRFDVVMTDVSLPGMSGIDLAKEILGRYPNLPVVIASGYGGLQAEFMSGTPHPHVFILSKPYDMDMLEKTLVAASAIR